MKQHKFTRLTAKQIALEKRYKDVPANARRGLAVMNSERPLAHLDGPKPIIDRYLAGESIVKIAKTMNVSDTALYDYLWDTIPDRWPKLRAARAESQYDGAVESMADRENSSLDGLGIACARETARFRFGEMAALRREFSQKQEVTTTQQPVFNIQIVTDSAPVITVSPPQQQAVEHDTSTDHT